MNLASRVMPWRFSMYLCKSLGSATACTGPSGWPGMPHNERARKTAALRYNVVRGSEGTLVYCRYNKPRDYAPGICNRVLHRIDLGWSTRW